MKRLLLFVAIVGLAASLGAQSLTELAKREKARREALKGRPVVLVKNADLLRVQKVPGVEVAPPEEAADETPEGGPETLSADVEQAVPPSGSGAPSGRRIVPSVAPNGPLITGEANRDQLAEGNRALEAQLQAAKDLVDLLETKMNALRQQYEFQDAMVPGYVIQQQLDETNQRLVKAQAQQARIEAQIQKQSSGRKGAGGDVR